MRAINTICRSSCSFHQRAGMLCMAFLALFAQVGRADDTLRYFKNYFVTGDYAVAGVGLRGTGVAGTATGNISMSGVPDGADIVAAFLYWETVELTSASPSSANGFFRGNAIVGRSIGQNSTAACVSWKGTPALRALRTYRADVLRYLPVDSSRSIRLANGTHEVKLPDSGNFAAGTLPLTEGASLVVVYRLLTLGTPLRSVVIYDGEVTVGHGVSALNLTMGGFYQASATAAAKMTHIVGDSTTGNLETLRVNTAIPAGLSATNPFNGLQGTAWDNLTFNYPLAADAATVQTQVVPGSPFDCLSWSAIVTSTAVKDTDGDGLLDIWEQKGMHLDPGDATHPAKFGTCYDESNVFHDADNIWPCVNLPAMQASATRKDIFVEIDWLQGTDGHLHKPKLDALNAIGSIFNSHGIRVHFDVGNSYQSTSALYIVPTRYSAGGEVIQESTLLCPNTLTSIAHCAYSKPYAVLGWKVGFRAVKDGFPALSLTPHFAHNRKDIYHYALFAHALSTGPFGPTGVALSPDPASVSGVADTSADMMVTLGLWDSDVAADDNTGSPLVQAGTLMHELGHNLGLSHAGTVRLPNCEPNYPSVMNYLYQTHGLFDAAGLPHVDFSSGQLLPLSENSLSETASLGPLTYRLRYYAPAPAIGGHVSAHCDGSPIVSGDFKVRLDTLGLSIPDWNNNGKVDADVPLDVNFSGSVGDGVTGGNFLDSNDWVHLNLQQVGARMNVGGLSGDVGQQDLGQQDLGQQDLGQQDLGQQDLGQQDLGQQDLGQQDLGTGQETLTYPQSEIELPPANNPAQPLTAALSGPAGGPNGIALSWGAPIGMAPIRQYDIYRGTDPAALSQVTLTAGTPPAPGYTDPANGPTGLLYNTNYYFAEVSEALGTDGFLHPGTASNTVGPIMIKHLFIKANDKNRPYGAANPAVFDFVVTGGQDPGLSGSTTCGTTATPASNVGTYPITCSGLTPASGVTYTAGTLSITSVSQTITFAALADKTYSDPDFPVSATATSGLPVSFTADGNCTVSGTTVHLTGPGSCTITAHQAGNLNFTAAPDVARSFNIGDGGLNVLWYTGGVGTESEGESGGPTDYRNRINALAASASSSFPNRTWHVTFWDSGTMPLAPAGGWNVLVVTSSVGPWSPSPDYSALETAQASGALQIIDANYPLTHRVLITGHDADWHYMNYPGPTAFDGPRGFLLNNINWAGSGSGMGVVLLGDVPAPTFTGFTFSNFSSDSIVIPSPESTYPIHTCITSAGLSNWFESAHAEFGFGSLNTAMWHGIARDGDAEGVFYTTIVSAPFASGDIRPGSGPPPGACEVVTF